MLNILLIKERKERIPRPPCYVILWAVLDVHKKPLMTGEIMKLANEFCKYEGWPTFDRRTVYQAIRKLSKMGIVKTRKMFRGPQGNTLEISLIGELRGVELVRKGKRLITRPRPITRPITQKEVARASGVPEAVLREKIRKLSFARFLLMLEPSIRQFFNLIERAREGKI